MTELFGSIKAELGSVHDQEGLKPSDQLSV